MSQHTYTVVMSGERPQDIGQITRDDGQYVLWSDADFQAWNAAQPTPFVLSASQQAIQTAKGWTLAQFQGKSQAIKDQVVFELLQRTLKNEII